MDTSFVPTFTQREKRKFISRMMQELHELLERRNLRRDNGHNAVLTGVVELVTGVNLNEMPMSPNLDSYAKRREIKKMAWDCLKNFITTKFQRQRIWDDLTQSKILQVMKYYLEDDDNFANTQLGMDHSETPTSPSPNILAVLEKGRFSLNHCYSLGSRVLHQTEDLMNELGKLLEMNGYDYILNSPGNILLAAIDMVSGYEEKRVFPPDSIQYKYINQQQDSLFKMMAEFIEEDESVHEEEKICLTPNRILRTFIDRVYNMTVRKDRNCTELYKMAFVSVKSEPISEFSISQHQQQAGTKICSPTAISYFDQQEITGMRCFDER
ncbi:hypothetical protein CRE_24210 [Caenorhabditis remanei]|uniref:Uncharacterized protein n=1 Tax=Caenorhabditis remanei TaxID=31234 RepID=E3NCY0_CAERE|nr:hypothetical protein CRE_24210 [Caenorhabditis remanei]